MMLYRRQLLQGIAALCCGAVAPHVALANAAADADLFDAEKPFSWDALLAEAQALASEPYAPRRDEVPEPVRELNYNEYRAIRPGPQFPQQVAEGSQTYFDPLPAGFVYKEPVEVWIVADGTARRVRAERDVFAISPPAAEALPHDTPIPLSGVRLRGSINDPNVLDEYAVFQGASYFRAVGGGESYGLSARGLAIDTGQPTGEEFPVFRAFYVAASADEPEAAVVFALLDSPSTSGAYRIDVRPGDSTTTEVDLTLFPRRDIETIGFAPFSSMFLFDGINRAAFDDYRFAVHDSDGLSIHTGAGEWIWRPLTNPKLLQVSAFITETTPRGFGLTQRKRRFEDYQDAEARYERRPTAWVVPRGDWGPGSVVLFEIPSDMETNDNIVAYWQPDGVLPAGEPYSLAYSIIWDDVAPDQAAGPQVLATRRGINPFGGDQLFVIDYDMGGASLDDVSVNVETSAGKVDNIIHYVTPQEDVLRVSFELDPDAQELAELRVVLNAPDAPPAERWLFRWTA